MKVAVLVVGRIDTGGRTYLAELLGPLSSQPGLEFEVHLSDPEFEVPESCQRVLHRVPHRAGPAVRILAGLWIARRLSRAGYDVLLAPFNFMPATWRGPCVVIEHSVLAIRPAHTSLLRAWYRRRALALTLRRATEVVAVSAYLRELLLEHFPSLDPALVHVAPAGVPTGLLRPALPRVSPPCVRVLCIGALWPHKRIDQAVAAFARASRGLERAELVIAGPGARSARRDLEALALRLGVRERVRFVGNVPHQRLAELYASADALLFLSETESFGLPVLEAMALGLPVIARRVGGVAEVGGDGPLWVENDAGVTEIADLLQRLVTTPQLAEERRRAGLEQARRFEWRPAAVQVAECLGRAAAGTSVPSELHAREGAA